MVPRSSSPAAADECPRVGGQPVEGAVLREPMAFLAALSAEKAKLKKTTPQEPTRAPTGAYPVIGMASIMAEKAHGTTAAPVQTPLRWGVDGAVADRICSFNPVSYTHLTLPTKA